MFAAVGLFIVYIVIVVIILWWSYKIDGEKLTNDELDEISNITMNFHKSPNWDDFDYVFSKHKHLLKARRAIKFWLWGVYIAHPDYYNDAKKEILNSYMEDIKRGLRRFKIKPTNELLDCIWAIYFATGDVEYAHMVGDIAKLETDASIARAAKWSYKSIMGEEPGHNLVHNNDNGDNDNDNGDNNNDNIANIANIGNTSATTNDVKIAQSQIKQL